MTGMSFGAGTRLVTSCLLAALLLTAGCMRVEFTKPELPSWFAAVPEGPAKGPVVTVTSFWLDGVVVQPDPGSNGALLPGFMGKIYLYGVDDLNVEADGALTVQLYDDQQVPTTPPTPRETWTIESAVLKTALRKDLLGWYYNLWLPWTFYDRAVTQVTLVVQYKDATGRIVWSKPHYMAVQDQYGIRKPSHLEVSESKKQIGK